MMAPDLVRRRNPQLLVYLCFTAYFGYHAIQGRHGFEARSRLIERSAQLAREIRALETVRVRLERETVLLNEFRPDPDFVDELARQTLGFARSGDHIIVERSASPRPAIKP